ncbi:MAG TPA: helix-turn-helix domain-containing protein [Phycisphaerae bacterium]|nr:helix-turn-helix domain-containing protein [Phycisphaerae bacterium]
MKRDELFTTGTYASLTLRVMARPDLTPAAKLVWQALASHLRNGDEWVWPSLERLAAMIGCDRATVVRAVASLRAAGEVQTRRQGRCTAYRFLPPGFYAPGQSAANCDGSQIATGRILSTEAPQNAAPTRRNLRPEVLNGSTLKNNSPQPPAVAGGGADSFATCLEKMEAAYREVHDGQPMPLGWRRRAKRDFDARGDSVIGLIDAAAIRAGRKLALDQKRTFGIGWVFKHLEAKAAVASERKRAAAAAAQSSAVQVGDGDGRVVRFTEAQARSARERIDRQRAARRMVR